MYSANCKGMYSNLACFIRQKGEGLINQSWMAQNRAVGTYEGVKLVPIHILAYLLTLPQSWGEGQIMLFKKKLVPNKNFDIPAAL